jgi:SAM-dependent methyltransferase
MEPEPGSLAEYFDGWYADMTGSPVQDEIQQRHLGLPPHLLSTSLLGWDGIAEAAAGLRLSPGGALVDLACGRGGYGLEIAARTGAQLAGVDFSAEAVRQAREHARQLRATAEFRIGDLAATGLDAGSADAVLCVDAIQFASRPGAAYREIARVLTSGGRVVLTCWEPLDRTTNGFPNGCGGSTWARGWPLPGSETSRSATAPAGGQLNAPCGRKPPRSTLVMTPRYAHSTTRACAPWRSSVWSAGSWPPRPHHRRPAHQLLTPTAERGPLIEICRTVIRRFQRIMPR